jgi:hypothetical protein
MSPALYIVMALSTAELLDLAAGPRNPWGELRLIWRLYESNQLPNAPVVVPPVARQVLARAA